MPSTTRTWSRGWYVELDHPDGQTIRPQVVGDPSWEPQVRGLPRVKIPVPTAARWREERDRLEGQPLRLYYDGHQLPIDELRDVQLSPEQAVLVGKGGLELDSYAEGIEYIEEDAHVAAEEIITSETTYAANVDDPATDTRSDVRMQSADSSSSWEDAVGADIGRTQPIYIWNSALRMQQAGWFREGENGTGDAIEMIESNGDWSSNKVMRLEDATHELKWSFSTDYPIPEGGLAYGMLYSAPNDNHPALSLRLNGSEFDSVPEGGLISTDSNTDVRWISAFVANPTSELSEGTHSVEINVQSSPAENIYIDAIHVGDDREPFNYDGNPVDGIVDGPEEFPGPQTITAAAVSSIEQVIAGRQESSWNDISGGQAIAIRNDTTDSTAWTEATNAELVEANFAAATQEIQTRFTLDRWGEQVESPRHGIKGQTVDLFDLYADLEDTPVLLDKAYRGTLVEILNRIADAGTFVWEARWDPDLNNGAGGYVVEWTQSGQRTVERAPDLVDWEVTETVEDAYERVVVFGAAHDINGEAFSNSTYDSFEGIDEDHIVTASETVYDPSDGTEFERGTDYNMWWSEGAIELLSGGSMSTGTTYEIDYRHKSRGEHELPDAGTDPRTLRREIAEAATDRECEQLALGILKEVQDPLLEVEIEVTTSDPRWPLVEALSHSDLPVDGPLTIRNIEFGEQSIRLYLGSRESIADVVDSLRTRITAVSERS